MARAKKNILGLIPARGGSKGLKNKNIKLLDGKPLIYHTISEALKSKLITDVVVSTDSNKIINISRQLNAKIHFKRPRYLAKDNTNIFSVIKHHLNWCSKRNNFYDCVVLLQPTSPFRNYLQIDECISLYYKKNKSTVVSIKELDHACNPESLFILKEDTRIKRISSKKETRIRQKKKKYFARNGPAILVLNPDFNDFDNIYSNDVYGYLMDQYASIDIDNEFDFSFAKFLLNDLK
jgi:CMP-N-acetylneuraminic acid synthetase